MNYPTRGFSRNRESMSRTKAGARTDRSASTTRHRGHCAGLLLTMLLAGGPLHAADVMKGAQLYARHCSACHGPSGISVMPGAPNLARAERMMQSDMMLMATLKSGKNAMPAYIGILNDVEMLDVIAYSRTLR